MLTRRRKDAKARDRWNEISAPLRLCVMFFVLSAVVLSGCTSETGPKRYRVSGEVRFAGEPVPYGEILFTPDSAKGNSGPQGIAIIANGKDDTAGTRAPGVAGGPTVVQVTALRDLGGKLIGEYQFNIDLPKADTTHDIDVPASAMQKKRQGPEI
jgi:hypothetical protein